MDTGDEKLDSWRPESSMNSTMDVNEAAISVDEDQGGNSIDGGDADIAEGTTWTQLCVMMFSSYYQHIHPK